MEQLRDMVRSKVDEMRAAGHAQRYDRAKLVDALSNAVPAGKGSEATQHGGTIHMCPWHTCQATRHG